jgi:hypothetical protein
MGEAIELHCNNNPRFEGVKFLWERPEILDIGGAIHNLASQDEVNYQGRLLVLNADQFFYLQPDVLQSLLSPLKDEASVLFTYKVNSSDGYNGLEIDPEGKIRAIIKNQDIPRNSAIPTYTGISLIDLSKLKKVPGISKFFDSVCLLASGTCHSVLLEGIDYWDFGTVKRYWESMFRILETYRTHSMHPFLRFLVNERAMKSWKINLQTMSYFAKSPRVINLSAEEVVQDLGPSIILSRGRLESRTLPTVWWNEIMEEVK